jgi:hypothetical protein
MVEVYQAHRPAGEDSSSIDIADRESALSENSRGVIVAPATKAIPLSRNATLSVEDEPLSRDVDWNEVAKDAVVGDPPGEIWHPVVSQGNRVLVAMRESPARRIWVGFRSPSFATRADFVIFWTNIFDWVGQGGEAFVSEPVGSIGEEWKLQTQPMDRFDISPGVYQRSDGMLRALNANDVRFSPASKNDGPFRLPALVAAADGGTNLSPAISLAAIFMVLASALLWKSATRFSAA